MRQPRLRTRLTLWFAASILLIVTPIMALLAGLQWRSMRSALDHHLEEDLEVAAQMIVAHGTTLTWRTETDRDPGYDAAPRRWVEVYGDSTRPVFVRGFAERDDIRAALDAPSARASGYRTFTTPAGAHVRSLTAQRQIGGQSYWLRVVRTEDDLRRDLRWLMILFSAFAAVAVLVAAASGHVISGGALSPLARMAERARIISADRLSERLPVENPDDELGQLAIVFNDTFAGLDQSFERLKRFTADASHELRTPLTAIRSVGEVGLREAKSPEAYREVIGSMLEEADHMASLVTTLLTLSRWESGRMKPARADIDLRELAQEIVAQLSVLAEDRNVAVEVDVPPGLILASDPLMARQAVVNVVDNAIKYTRFAGHVRLSAMGGAECTLVVDDDGAGIPADKRTRVLERFYRMESTREQSPGGAGLGLAIAHWAMTANHGRITIADSPFGGTRVVLAWQAARS